MGFSETGDTITLVAKLTPFGRRTLLGSSSGLITHFSVGDSDANYNAEMALGNGETPVAGGDLGVNNSFSNGVIDTAFRSNVLANAIGSVRKLVEPSSTRITTTESKLGQVTLGSTALTHNVVDRTAISSDSLVNLFYSFGLPITTTDDYIFTGAPSTSGGFSDTALSGLAQDNIIVIGIDEAYYGEKLDGKEISITIDVSGTGYTMYSTFQKGLSASATQDGRTKETSVESALIGDNIAFLFSDSIKRPNNDVSKSWSTGFGYVKPFTDGKKSQFNLKANTSAGLVPDEAVGIAYLDKGFIVITHPTIVNNFNLLTGSSATTITYNHTATKVTQNILCTLNPGEFSNSNNPTYSKGQNLRISEVGLHNAAGELIAIGKFNKHYVKGPNQFAAFTVKLEV